MKCLVIAVRNETITYQQFAEKNSKKLKARLVSRISELKGTVSQDFLLLVFFLNQFPPSL